MSFTEHDAAGIAFLLWSADPGCPERLATPFFHAAAAAAMDMPVEIYFSAASVRLLVPAVAAGLRASSRVEKTIADNLGEAVQLGARLFACSDALAAQVGGIGIAPGANMSDSVAMFEATHGTAPKYAGKDYVNPGSEILSAEMMLRHVGWTEAADLIIRSMEKSIQSKKVTYDFARLMEGATQVSCSGFGQVMIDNM